MRLSSQSSQFIFQLPPNLLQPEIINSYKLILEKNFIQYENVIDYLNSTIKSVSFPGISFESPAQHIKRGKELKYYPSKNIQDIVGSRSIDITFASVDADLNYWILFDIIQKKYLDNAFWPKEDLYVKPFTLTCLDVHRDGIYQIIFEQIIIQSLDANRFDYGQQKVASKDFTLSFNFNFYHIKFLLDNEQVLELDSIPTIIQKI